tara:strand:+ start:6551 stop:6751 length:201 start_codon:yes stop_codon:yes gene_type:complete
MIRKLIANVKNIRTTVLGVATLLVAAGSALSAWVDGDVATEPDWTAVAVAFSSVIASLALIFASKD